MKLRKNVKDARKEIVQKLGLLDSRLKGIEEMQKNMAQEKKSRSKVLAHVSREEKLIRQDIKKLERLDRELTRIDLNQKAMLIGGAAFVILLFLGYILWLNQAGIVGFAIFNVQNHTEDVGVFADETMQWNLIFNDTQQFKSLMITGQLYGDVVVYHEDSVVLNSSNILTEEEDISIGDENFSILSKTAGSYLPLEFSSPLNDSCLEFMIYSYELESDTRLCAGDTDCCNFLELEPIREINSSLMISQGSYGTSKNDLVRVQQHRYMVDIENLDYESYSSDIFSFNFSFNDHSFADYCEDTCDIDINDSIIVLTIFVNSGNITIDSLTYSEQKVEQIVQEEEFSLSQIGNISLDKNTNATVDLSSYVNKANVEFSVFDVSNINLSIDGSNLLIVPDNNFTGSRYTFISANHSGNVSVSNLVKVSVEEPKVVEVNETRIKPTVVVGRPVKWVKRVSTNGLSNLSINISEEAINISVNRVINNVSIPLSRNKIKVKIDDELQDVDDYELDKQAERLDSEIEKLNRLKIEYSSNISKIAELNEQITSLTNYRNTITGYAVIQVGDGLLSRFFRLITGYAVIDQSRIPAVICGNNAEPKRLLLLDSSCNPIGNARIYLRQSNKGFVTNKRTESDGSADFSDYSGKKDPSKFEARLNGIRYSTDDGSYDSGIVLQTLNYSFKLVNSSLQAIDNVRIRLLDSNDKSLSNTRTDNEGVASFEVLPNSLLKHKVTYNGADYITDLINVSENTLITLQTYNFGARIIDDSSEPVSNVRVRLRKENNGSAARKRTDIEGWAGFEVLPESKVSIEVRYKKEDYRTALFEITNNTIVDIMIINDSYLIDAYGNALMHVEEIEAETNETNAAQELPVNETLELIIDEDIDEAEIEYYTDGPTATEIVESDVKKTIIISSDIHYQDILAYTTLENESRESAIKLFNVINDSRIAVNFTAYDLNNNSLVDYIEWIVPHLSNQTYEVVIEITSAKHLDENRDYIEDIYYDVMARDGIWKEIPSNHYVRVEFEENLTSEKDITIFARSNYSNASIIIYEYGQSSRIAGFDSVMEEGFYKVYLDRLNGTQSKFDLLINGSAVELDYIVDPTDGIPRINFTPPTLSNDSTTYDDFVEVNVSIDDISLDSVIWNWNGTNYTIYDNNTILAFNLENNSNIGENDTYAVDYSRYGNNGTIYNNAEFVSGKFGSGLSFDGKDDYVSVVDKEKLNLSTLSIGFWFKPSVDYAAGSDYVVLVYHEDYEIFINGGQLTFRYGTSNLTASLGEWNKDVWYYILATYDGYDQRLYVNSELDSTSVSKFFITDAAGAYVASFDNSGNIVLVGSCVVDSCEDSDEVLFVIQDNTGDTLAYINSSGDMCIETGTCDGGSASCPDPGDDSFLIQNGQQNVGYIDSTGDLCLIGTLTEGGTP